MRSSETGVILDGPIMISQGGKVSENAATDEIDRETDRDMAIRMKFINTSIDTSRFRLTIAD